MVQIHLEEAYVLGRISALGLVHLAFDVTVLGRFQSIPTGFYVISDLIELVLFQWGYQESNAQRKSG